jgi:hypothetical protein
MHFFLFDIAITLFFLHDFFQNKFHAMKINIHKKSNNLNLGKKYFLNKTLYLLFIHCFFFKYYHDL